MPDRTEPATNAPALPTSAIPVPLVPPAGRPGGRPRPNRRPGEWRPLPDAQAIYSFAVPEIGPPYDDSAPVKRLAGGAGRGRLTSVTTGRRSGRGDGPDPGLARQPARRQAPGNQPPEAGPWPGHFAQVLAETLAGSRPVDQIVPWTTEQARRRISQLGPMLAATHRPRVRRVIVSSPASGVLEMTVILALDAHVRAVAVRLERADARTPGGSPARGERRTARPASPRASQRAQHAWLCTAIEAA